MMALLYTACGLPLSTVLVLFLLLINNINSLPVYEHHSLWDQLSATKFTFLGHNERSTGHRSLLDDVPVCLFRDEHLSRPRCWGKPAGQLMKLKACLPLTTTPSEDHRLVYHQWPFVDPVINSINLRPLVWAMLSLSFSSPKAGTPTRMALLNVRSLANKTFILMIFSIPVGWTFTFWLRLGCAPMSSLNFCLQIACFLMLQCHLVEVKDYWLFLRNIWIANSAKHWLVFLSLNCFFLSWVACGDLKTTTTKFLWLNFLTF